MIRHDLLYGPVKTHFTCRDLEWEIMESCYVDEDGVRWAESWASSGKRTAEIRVRLTNKPGEIIKPQMEHMCRLTSNALTEILMGITERAQADTEQV